MKDHTTEVDLRKNIKHLEEENKLLMANRSLDSMDEVAYRELQRKNRKLIEELRVEHKQRQEAEGETTIVKAIGHNSPEMKQAIAQIKELENRLSEALMIEGEHQKLNGNLRSRIIELEQDNLELYADNKKISRQIEDRVERARKAGM